MCCTNPLSVMAISCRMQTLLALGSTVVEIQTYNINTCSPFSSITTQFIDMTASYTRKSYRLKVASNEWSHARNCCPVYHFYNIIKPDNIVIMYHYFRIVSQTLRQKTTVISDAHNNTWTMITEWNYYRCNKAYLYCCIGFISKALIAIYPPWNMCISCRLKLGQAPLSSLHVYMTLGCLNSQLDTQKQLCKIKKSLQSSLVRLATVIEGRPAPDDDTAATCIPYWLYFLRPVNEKKSNWIPVFLPGNCSRRVHKEIH